MLQVKAMALGDLAVHCLLDPGYLVNHLVSKFIKDIQSEPVLCIDHPNEEEAALLNLVEGNLENLFV